MSSTSLAVKRLELAADVKLAPLSAEAEARLAEVFKSYAIVRLGSVSPAMRSYQRHAIVGVLSAERPLGSGWLAWTLVEVRTTATKQDASACVLVPDALANPTAIGRVVCVLDPQIMLSTSRTAVCLRVKTAGQLVVLGRASGASRCARCNTLINRLFGTLCAKHQAADVPSVKCNRMDIAMMGPKCHFTPRAIPPRRQLSPGTYHLEGARMTVDKTGQVALGEADAAAADDDEATEKEARSREVETERVLMERFPQAKDSLGNRYLVAARQAAEREAAAHVAKPEAAPLGTAGLPHLARQRQAAQAMLDAQAKRALQATLDRPAIRPSQAPGPAPA
jgi:hypothetical protein